MSQPRVPLEQRLWARINKTGDCWIWTGSKNNKGYGTIAAGRPSRATLLVHRVAYELTLGTIPEGLILDHRCHVPACVRPEHLRPASQRQNIENRAGSAGVTGVRDVFPVARTGKYIVRVMQAGKRYTIGTYTTIAEAEVAAIAARNKLHTHNDADRRAA